MRLLDFSDSFESATEPSQGVLEASALRVFADDAAFVTDKGTAVAQGDIYSRSSDDVIRYYNGTAWVSLANLSDLTSANISFSPVGTIAASDLQTAVAEVATDAASALSSHESDTTSVHGIADTSDLLTTSNTKSVTNKDIDGGTASNTSRITLPKASKATLDALTRKEGTVVYASDTDKLYYDDGSVLKLVGSGSGSGTNFITDGDAEGTQIFTVYNDSSTTRPVDGTGSTQANLAVSISSSSPLAGTNSFLFTKSGSASTQGSGASIPFTIDSAYKAKVLQIEFDYIVNSGTFVAGSSSTESDVIAYIYDVTNSTLIEPSSIKFLSNSSTISDKFVANFQTSATGTSYRLILHCQSTSTANYELKLDNIKISPCQYVYGTPISDWVSYTPTGSWTTNTTYTGRWRRVGDTLESQINLVLAGAPTAADLTVNFLPSGLTVDTAKMAAFSFGSIGDANIIDSGSRVYIANPAYNGGSSVYIVHTESGNTGIVNATNPTTFASADNVRLNIRVPISGWSSSVQVSDGYDGRLIAATYSTLSSTTITSGTALRFTSLVEDKTASYNTSTGAFVAPSQGTYEFTISGINTNTISDVNLFVGASDKGIFGSLPSGTGRQSITIQYPLNAGDSVTFVPGSSGTASDTTGWFMVRKLQAPTTISATEVVAARYTTAAGQSIANGATSIIDFETKDYDTHNAVTTGASWKFIAPAPGLYSVKSFIRYANVLSWTAGSYVNASFYKNGSAFSTADELIQSTITPGQGPSAKFTDSVWLNAGDYIDMRTAHGESSARALVAAGTLVRIAIERIK